MEMLPPETLKAILSFCDLRSLVRIRRVSQQFWALSDEIPKRWINVSDLLDHQETSIGRTKRIHAFVKYAGNELVGLTGLDDATFDEENLGKLLRILSQYCPKLKILHLSHIGKRSWSNLFYILPKHQHCFFKLEEIYTDRIPYQIILDLPGLKRIKGLVVDGKSGKGDASRLSGCRHIDNIDTSLGDAEVIASRLSGCRHIDNIDSSLVIQMATHFYKNGLECPTIRGLVGVVHIASFELHRDGHEDSVGMLTTISRMFPEAWYSVTIVSAECTERIIPIVGRTKRVHLKRLSESLECDKEAPILSSMVYLKELRIYIKESRILGDYSGHRDYSKFFSFLSNLPHIEHLEFYDFQADGLAGIVGMLSPCAPLKRLRLKNSYFNGNKLSKVLSQHRFPLESLFILDRDVPLKNAGKISRSFLEPIFEASPGITDLTLAPCSDGVVKLVPRLLNHLSSFHCEPCSVDLALELAKERIASGRVVPVLTVSFEDSNGFAGVNFAEQQERFSKLGIKLNCDHDERIYEFKV